MQKHIQYVEFEFDLIFQVFILPGHEYLVTSLYWAVGKVMSLVVQIPYTVKTRACHFMQPFVPSLLFHRPASDVSSDNRVVETCMAS